MHQALSRIIVISIAALALSNSEIEGAIKTKQFRIQPSVAKLNPAGIDLRIQNRIELKPGQQRLAATLERVELSEKILGILHIRSSLAREGVVASLALVDPGFKGQLTVSLYNAGDRPVRMRKGERFIQLSLLGMGRPATEKYDGRYQESRGVVHSRRRQNVRHAKTQNVIHGVRG